MILNWTKLLTDLLPRQLRRVKLTSLLTVLTKQIQATHISLLVYMSHTQAIVLRNYSVVSLERMLYEEMGVSISIAEGSGQPIDFIVNINGYVDEQRVHALLDKYKLAGKSYQIVYSEMAWGVQFIDHICERGVVTWISRCNQHVCERREDITICKFVNHICHRGPQIYLVPGEVTYSGSSADQVKVNIVVNPQSTDINNYYTSYLQITYSLLARRGGSWIVLRTASITQQLHQTDRTDDWNRLDAFWIARESEFKVRIDNVAPSSDANYIYLIKNN